MRDIKRNSACEYPGQKCSGRSVERSPPITLSGRIRLALRPRRQVGDTRVSSLFS